MWEFWRVEKCAHHAEIHVEALERRLQVDLRYRLLLCLREGQVAIQDGGVECEGIHILRTSCVDLAAARKLGALCLSF